MLPAGTFYTRYKDDTAVIRTRFQRGLTIAFLICLFVIPYFFVSASWLTWLSIAAIYIIIVEGLHILTGLTGQISIGHAAFMGIGAYTSANLVNAGVPFLGAFVAATLMSGVICVLFGLPALRVKGFYLALATLAAQMIFEFAAKHLPQFTEPTLGLKTASPSFGGLVLASPAQKYVLVMAVCVIMIIVAKNLMRSNTGRAFMAVRDNDIAAEVMGINIYRTKLIAFFISGIFAGVGGALWAHLTCNVEWAHFTLMTSIWFLGMLVVGGIGSTAGAVFGPLFVRGVDKGVREILPLMQQAFPSVAVTLPAALTVGVFGLVVILFLIFEPRGINHFWTTFKNWYRIHPFAY